MLTVIVVRSPEDAAGQKNPFDYVLLCVKALPDVYDLAAVIESVVTPQHTCILINTGVDVLKVLLAGKIRSNPEGCRAGIDPAPQLTPLVGRTRITARVAQLA